MARRDRYVAGLPKRGAEKESEPDRFYLLGRGEAALALRERELARKLLELISLRNAVDERMTTLMAMQAQLMGLLQALGPAITKAAGPPAAAPPPLPPEVGAPAGMPAQPALPDLGMPPANPPTVGQPPQPAGGPPAWLPPMG